ncbi:DNA cytosine methyltransferase [Sphingobacterium sp. HMA12]|uniref:DNA cytosine methyltransferase n=1 Tax=Sphingobacterium sp. HMA12 TaxID=2050894 RepID=UPI000CEA3F38|nr:DNA cytosine methyltransferase [Sphingobacterium sp. HMA12]
MIDQTAVRHSEVGNIVSLYSGAGGLDIGFQKAGFNTIWANDIDRFATQTYQNYFPNHTVTTGDLLLQELPKVKDLALVIGGPPCQGFSIAGKMDPKDPRSKHVWNFISVVANLNPRGFVMENVKALATNTRWQRLRNDLVIEAQKLGYKTKLFLLNAAHYGVPQARERMFLVGFKDNEPFEPKATTYETPISVFDALSKLPKYGSVGNDGICTAKITVAKNPILRKSPFAGMLFNGQGRPLNVEVPALTLPASMGGNRTPIIDQIQLEIKGAKSWISEYHQHLLAGGAPNLAVSETLRRLTVEEAACLQTFPKGMEFSGTQTTKYRQIGNAVPPMLAYNVALAIKQLFE